jgi:hypothetical protein
VGSARANASACAPCADNSKASPYNVARCACSAGFYDAHFGASLTAPACAPCLPGGVCTTGFLAAAAGYWRETTASDVLHACREGKCVAENVTGPLSEGWDAALALSLLSSNGDDAVRRRALLQVAASDGDAMLQLPRADLVPINCAEGATGPLCGVCLPGYALQSGECAPCDPADAWVNWSPGAKTGLLIGCLVFAALFISLALFQPVVPPLERAVAAGAGCAKACFVRTKSKLTCGRLGATAAATLPAADAEVAPAAKASAAETTMTTAARNTASRAAACKTAPPPPPPLPHLSPPPPPAAEPPAGDAQSHRTTHHNDFH